MSVIALQSLSLSAAHRAHGRETVLIHSCPQQKRLESKGSIGDTCPSEQGLASVLNVSS